MNAYRRWLREQLAALDEFAQHPDPDHDQYDGIADVIADARRRAADAGLPDAVQACRVRRGGLTATAARMILQSCLASAVKGTRPRGGRLGRIAPDAPLSVKQASEPYNVAVRTLYALVADGSLRHSRVGTGRGTIRINPADLKRLLANGSSKAGLLD
jgi:excisionase family DNA binding protein